MTGAVVTYRPVSSYRSPQLTNRAILGLRPDVASGGPVPPPPADLGGLGSGHFQGSSKSLHSSSLDRKSKVDPWSSEQMENE
jgi:hypothetical protein